MNEKQRVCSLKTEEVTDTLYYAKDQTALVNKDRTFAETNQPAHRSILVSSVKKSMSPSLRIPFSSVQLFPYDFEIIIFLKESS
ncbi:MAG: hypothetical protein II719_07505, partial [Clostridia bacterium]|nr:hypothetical protein [Clostridia bacterium]